MRWDRGHRSDFVEDRRGERVSSFGGTGGITLLLFVFRRFGIAGVVVVLLVMGGLQFFGGGMSDPAASRGAGAPGQAAPGGAEEEELKAFVSFVLDDLQATWSQIYTAEGQTYAPARLVLFTDRVQSACGGSSAATGPFYCPGDQKVYIDLSFYRALRERLGAPGDFAQAYVIAHEIGHHVQNLQRNLDRGRDQGATGGSVRVELQADCYAGVWAHHAERRQLLEVGDLEEAFRAAEAIGDDALQGGSGGVVRPETFTHGSSAQRKRWFERGYASGAIASCDTFGANPL